MVGKMAEFCHSAEKGHVCVSVANNTASSDYVTLN